jgi:hypothetical protein
MNKFQTAREEQEQYGNPTVLQRLKALLSIARQAERSDDPTVASIGRQRRKELEQEIRELEQSS